MTGREAAPMAPVSTRRIAPDELEGLVPALVDLLCESVAGGASLGFLPPLDPGECRRYWLSLGADLRAGTRRLIGAYVSGRLVGSGQLVLASWPNARHRAEVQKLVVAAACRGQGIGRSLMDGLHDAARREGRSLLLLNARRGDGAEAFYKRLGYREVGIIPRYTIGSAGEPQDNVVFYRPLEP